MTKEIKTAEKLEDFNDVVNFLTENGIPFKTGFYTKFKEELVNPNDIRTTVSTIYYKIIDVEIYPRYPEWEKDNQKAFLNILGFLLTSIDWSGWHQVRNRETQELTSTWKLNKEYITDVKIK